MGLHLDPQEVRAQLLLRAQARRQRLESIVNQTACEAYFPRGQAVRTGAHLLGLALIFLLGFKSDPLAVVVLLAFTATFVELARLRTKFSALAELRELDGADREAA